MLPPITSSSASASTSAPATSATGADAAQAAAAAGQTLTQANFLQLLVTQMSTQDPLNPQSDTAFAAQLAQFSALQQSQNMSQNMSILQANSMIGEQVTANPTAGTTPIVGTVTGVQIQSGQPLVVINGLPYSLSQITGISPPPAALTTTANAVQPSK